MGGLGSGRYGGRPTVDSCLRFDLKKLRKLGMLVTGQKVSGTIAWTRDDEPFARIALTCNAIPYAYSYLDMQFTVAGESVSQRIPLEPAPMKFGGYRWYALCPYSRRRCTVLVLPNGGTRFASAKGWRLPHASQNEDAVGRAHRRIAKAENRLERLSKYARHPTWERLYREIESAEALLDYRLMRVVERWLRR